MALIAFPATKKDGWDWLGLHDQMSGVRNFLAEEGTHPIEELDMRFGWDVACDAYEMSVRCGACNRVWYGSVSGHDILRAHSANAYQDILARRIVPFFTGITKEICFKITSAAELAEWLTQRVSDAEPAGVSYLTLVREAQDGNLAAPSDVDLMLTKLSFIHEWQPRVWIPGDEVLVHTDGPLIRLPSGHPNRKEHHEHTR